jgi:hypothetical protein
MAATTAFDAEAPPSQPIAIFRIGFGAVAGEISNGLLVFMRDIEKTVADIETGCGRRSKYYEIRQQRCLRYAIDKVAFVA